MNVLFITSYLPYPPISGGRLQIFLRLKYLKHKGHRVFLLALARPEEYFFVTELKKIIDDVCCIYIKKDITKIFDLFRKSLLYEIFTYDKDFNCTAKKFLKDKTIDIAFFEQIGVAQYSHCTSPIPSILYEHNVEYEIVEQHVSSLRHFPSKIWQKGWEKRLVGIYLYLFGRREQKLVLNFESKAFRTFDLCLTCSERDAQILHKHSYGAPSITIPWCVEEPPVLHEPSKKNNYNLVFIGSMNWEPNRDAIIWFVKDIFPLVRTKLKNIRLLIAGSNMSDEIRSLDNKKDIIVVGYLPDISRIFLDGDIAIAPIRIGSGVKIKVIEAMSYGIPVITTTKGAEGLHAVHGEEFMIANSPEEFAENIATLVKSRNLRALIGMRGREYIQRYHRVDRVIELIERCMIDLVKGKDAKVIV